MINEKLGPVAPEQKGENQKIDKVIEVINNFGEGRAYTWIQQTSDGKLHFMIKAKNESCADDAKRELEKMGFTVKIDDLKFYFDADCSQEDIERIKKDRTLDIEDLRDKEETE